MQHAEVLETLQPIVQASQLLQARKTDDDVQSVSDMCNKLTTAQVIILFGETVLFNPVIKMHIV